LAKALTSYGYSYEACIEELVISNDDLTSAAAALVKRFGEPTANISPVVPSRKLSVSSLYLYSSFSILLFLTLNFF
jgi:hypothetical protein